MADLGARIVSELDSSTTALDDDQLAERLGAMRQAINQSCRRLAQSGGIHRGPGARDDVVW